jgi:hypothetical protein
MHVLNDNSFGKVKRELEYLDRFDILNFLVRFTYKICIGGKSKMNSRWKVTISLLIVILLGSTVLFFNLNNKDTKEIIIPSENNGNTDYSGIYYLHDDLPEHGQNIGNTHDVGDLLRAQPHGNEERYCAKWVQFDFDEHVFGEDIGDESYTITSIYYHIWWKSANKNADIGTEVHGLYDSHTEFSTSLSYDDSVSVSNKNGYWLTTHVQTVGYYEEDIHDMAVKVISIDAIPSVFSGTNQYSFIILNLEDNETLKLQDKDEDGITDYDDMMDGEDENPLSTSYRIVKEDWIIEHSEEIKGEKLLVNGDIIVKPGGRLAIKDTLLKMNQKGEQFRIKVEPGGELIIRDSELVTDDPDHWYSRTLNSEHWHDERTFEIYGKAEIVNNAIDYGSIIYVRESNDTIIEKNEISHFYYGLFCSYSNPKINDNIILPFIGNGIFLWHSDPHIINTIISTYIGTGISCYFSSPIIEDCEISGGSNDFFLSGGSRPIVSNSEFNTNMVHVDDSKSTLLIGSFESDDPQGKDNIESETRPQNAPSSMAVGVTLVIVILFIYFIVRKNADMEHKNSANSATKKEGKGEKSTKIRPKNSWKSKSR